VTARWVLDASAILAWLQHEPGSDMVDPLLPDAVISTVNWAEVLQKVAQRGRDAREVGDLLQALGVTPSPLSIEDAVTAAALWAEAPSLSLGDRYCLALSLRLKIPAVTADRHWATLDTGADIRLIRDGS
jgi:PIN domain nuclease of toxin-antitoxin system